MSKSKIKINVRPFNLKLEYPFGISRGSMDSAKNVLITITYGDVTAYGESAPSSYYGESQDSVINFIQSFLKYKSPEEYVTNIQKLKDDLNNFSSSLNPLGLSYAAKVGLEIAFWDLIGKINNRSLYQYLFYEDPFVVLNDDYENIPQTSFTVGLDNLLVIEEKVQKAIKAGHRILKIKLGKGEEADINILETVHKATKNLNCILRVDANGGWNLETTKKMLDILPKYKVELLEQPLPKGQAYLLSEIYNSSPIPIFVDEDCMVGNDIESVLGKVHGINIKLMKAGSVIEAVNMIKLARGYNLKVMLGCMIESSCSISAAAHLAPMADYVDLDGHLLLANDPFSGLMFVNNKVIPSLEPGLGVQMSDN
ncbi:MAG: hypothetical protein A3B68_04030 [Candidatus Melainabacteria bacterium RIFCSPHIGHO2_02_FULL_34_12]|nr:MAG: hypothetical protein A3B68_04030 [Candidatus Melainabacteria bacterium RIFCSPHIGHO2_02_FULL_34_12]